MKYERYQDGHVVASLAASRLAILGMRVGLIRTNVARVLHMSDLSGTLFIDEIGKVKQSLQQPEESDLEESESQSTSDLLVSITENFNVRSLETGPVDLGVVDINGHRVRIQGNATLMDRQGRMIIEGEGSVSSGDRVLKAPWLRVDFDNEMIISKGPTFYSGDDFSRSGFGGRSDLWLDDVTLKMLTK